jgi:hypothetical protein
MMELNLLCLLLLALHIIPSNYCPLLSCKLPLWQGQQGVLL